MPKVLVPGPVGDSEEVTFESYFEAEDSAHAEYRALKGVEVSA